MGVGGSAGEKSSRYYLNPDRIRFLFEFDLFSYQHLGAQPINGGSTQHCGGGGGGSDPPKRDIKLRPCLFPFTFYVMHFYKPFPNLFVSEFIVCFS